MTTTAASCMEYNGHRRESQLEQNAWKHATITYPESIPTMISLEEKEYLFWMAQKIWSGIGLVVEIGPWLGGSTICIAMGMKASGHRSRKKLHVIDNFIWREFMADRAPLPIPPGHSFQPFFEKNLQEYHEYLTIHARALPDEKIAGDAAATKTRFMELEQTPLFTTLSSGNFVEILHIDGAKSWRGMVHLLKTLQYQLRPGSTFFVCQDYKYWGAYWVPIMMEKLRDYVTPVHNVLQATTVTFQQHTPIPADLVENLVDEVRCIPVEEGLSLIEKTSHRLAADNDKLGAMNVSLSKISFLSHQEEVNAAVDEFRKIQGRWPLFENTAQLERARHYLATEKSRHVPQNGRVRLNMVLRKARAKVSRYAKGATLNRGVR